MARPNFVEQCRKDAGWPAMHRDCPEKKPGQQTWSMTQESLAAFVGQVRTRSEDLLNELQAKDELLQKCANEKANLVREISTLGVKAAAFEIAERIQKRAESHDLDSVVVKSLVDAAKSN